MATEVKLPELGENLEEGEVLDINVAPGDPVSEGQTLLEIEAEKSTVEVPSPVAGRLSQVLVKKGDRVRVGQPICLIEGSPAEKNGGAKTAPAREKDAEKKPEPAAPARIAATAERTPPAPPPAKEETSGDGKEAGRRPAAPAVTRPTPAVAPIERLVPAGPATRRLARELGVDINLVVGSAPGGRVTQEDVKEYVRHLAAKPAGGYGTQAPPLPDFSRWGPVEPKPLDSVRRKTAEQMSLAWALVPHVTQHDEADVTDLDAFRRQQSDSGPKLTVTAFVLKAVASALKQFPQFNSSLDISAGRLILKRYYHIGVAVDTERGLLVPVLRDVDRKSVRELAQELSDVAERARQKKITLEEMRGGTFTVTNLGGIAGTGFTPIVNYPEVAILGLSRSKLQPVVHDGQIVPRLVLPLSLSYDHRVIDGADAARFTHRIAEMLENPLQMLL
jgi:pyruvate dehydrogenase E2 component (dihydrolipoamide acetyltransferase)